MRGRSEPAWDAGMAPQRKGRGTAWSSSCSRNVRTIRMCSFDARNRGSTRLSPKRQVNEREWDKWECGLLISLARVRAAYEGPR